MGARGTRGRMIAFGPRPSTGAADARAVVPETGRLRRPRGDYAALADAARRFTTWLCCAPRSARIHRRAGSERRIQHRRAAAPLRERALSANDRRRHGAALDRATAMARVRA